MKGKAKVWVAESFKLRCWSNTGGGGAATLTAVWQSGRGGSARGRRAEIGVEKRESFCLRISCETARKRTVTVG